MPLHALVQIDQPQLGVVVEHDGEEQQVGMQALLALEFLDIQELHFHRKARLLKQRLDEQRIALIVRDRAEPQPFSRIAELLQVPADPPGILGKPLGGGPQEPPDSPSPCFTKLSAS
ncbi:hypothetical protein LJK87_43310 [Paenibacillus sp. P25]|nr:hypothetical protein LJK87_43310 [Paenibacillus sp. P25]